MNYRRAIFVQVPVVQDCRALKAVRALSIISIVSAALAIIALTCYKAANTVRYLVAMLSFVSGKTWLSLVENRRAAALNSFLKDSIASVHAAVLGAAAMAVFVDRLKPDHGFDYAYSFIGFTAGWGLAVLSSGLFILSGQSVSGEERRPLLG